MSFAGCIYVASISINHASDSDGMTLDEFKGILLRAFALLSVICFGLLYVALVLTFSGVL